MLISYLLLKTYDQIQSFNRVNNGLTIILRLYIYIYIYLYMYIYIIYLCVCVCVCVCVYKYMQCFINMQCFPVYKEIENVNTNSHM